MNELKRGYADNRIASFIYMLISFISETSDQNVMSPVIKLNDTGFISHIIHFL